MYSLQRKINRIGIFGENEGCVIEFPIVPLHAGKKSMKKSLRSEITYGTFVSKIKATYLKSLACLQLISLKC